MKRLRPPPRRERNAHTELPLGSTIHIQAFCRARRTELVYLGRDHSRFRIAATPKGCAALTGKGFTITPTPEVQGEKAIVIVTVAAPVGETRSAV